MFWVDVLSDKSVRESFAMSHAVSKGSTSQVKLYLALGGVALYDGWCFEDPLNYNLMFDKRLIVKLGELNAMKYHVLFFSIFGMAKIMAKKLPFLPSIFSPFSPYWQKWQTFPPIIAIMVKMANISSPFLSFFPFSPWIFIAIFASMAKGARKNYRHFSPFLLFFYKNRWQNGNYPPPNLGRIADSADIWLDYVKYLNSFELSKIQQYD